MVSNSVKTMIIDSWDGGEVKVEKHINNFVVIVENYMCNITNMINFSSLDELVVLNESSKRLLITDIMKNSIISYTDQWSKIVNYVTEELKTKLTKSQIQRAIRNRESGNIPNFSEITLNNAVDLILFENYSIEQILNMSDEQIDELANEDKEISLEVDSEYICPVCGENMVIEFTDSESDSACNIHHCKCNHCKTEKKNYDYSECF